jgi:hypothetical protein
MDAVCTQKFIFAFYSIYPLAMTLTSEVGTVHPELMTLNRTAKLRLLYTECPG